MSMSSHLRDSLLGWAAVMTSNSCLLANSFIAKHQPVTPGEILSSRLVSNKMALFSNKRLSSSSNQNYYFRSFLNTVPAPCALATTSHKIPQKFENAFYNCGSGLS